jgi:hypothetical protein
MTAEHRRLNKLQQLAVPVAQWGPYLSERQWGTVREDYSAGGNAWNYFPFEHAHARAYQWGEDGLAGISDRFQNLCFSVALWNGKDPILKERLFGLHNGEGNHGEDVKELYYYLDNVPSHFYMEYLYKYPQRHFPYEKLKEENRHRSRLEGEYEILDTNVFKHSRYFDVKVVYAKHSTTDIFIKIEVTNRYNKAADITVLPTLWFSKQAHTKGWPTPPLIIYNDETSVKATHERLGDYYFYTESPDDMLFTENATNFFKIAGAADKDIFVKDAFNDAIINGDHIEALRNKRRGTKFSSVRKMRIPAEATRTVYCRLTSEPLDNAFEAGFEQIFDTRKKEADAFYAAILPAGLQDDVANIRGRRLPGYCGASSFIVLM